MENTNINILDLLNDNYIKIKEDPIILHKDIDDNNIIISNQYRMVYIFDRNDIVYMNNRNHYISFFQTNKTEYYEKYLKLDNWSCYNAIYPYVLNKTIEEMESEECQEIKHKNKFLAKISSRNLNFILKLEKRNFEYYMCYYVKNTILENITNNTKENILTKTKIISDVECQKLLEKKNKELEYLMEPTELYNNYPNNKNETDILKESTVLYDYQKRDIFWMEDIENKIIKNENSIDFNYSTIHSVLDDKYILTNDSILPAKIINKNIKTSSTFKYFGGNLISEVGLGKTIVALYHILQDTEFNEERNKLDQFIEFSYNCNYFFKRGRKKGQACEKECIENSLFCKEHNSSLFLDKRNVIYKNLHNFDPSDFLCKTSTKIKLNSTLIICPNHLCDQWVREYYDKFKNNKRILLLITKDQFNNLTLGDLLFSDIVITSYNILISNWYFTMFLNSKDMSFDDFKINEDLPITKEESVKLFLEKKKFNEFSLFKWRRIILDEAHEIKKMNKGNLITDVINNMLISQFKWNITGTPFSNGLLGYLNLMSYNTTFPENYLFPPNCLTLNWLTKYKLKSDVIKESKILFRRNTKKSIEQEIQKNIINQFLKLLEFTEEERSIYNSYEKGNKQKYSEFLIKLCCHCELNENTKTMIKKCKSLNEIKDALLNYNEKELKSLKTQKKEFEDNIKSTNEKIEELQSYNFQIDDDLIDRYKTNITTYKRQITNLNKSIDIIERTYNYLKNTIESQEEETCTICLESINKNETTITKCGHKFCWECISGLFTNMNNKKCPNCNKLLEKDDLYLYSYSNNNLNKDLSKNNKLIDIIQEVKSTKIGNIIYFLKQLLEEKDKNNKIIIFSQWDYLLDKVTDIMSDFNLKITQCKGTVYQKKKAIKEFTTSKDNNIIMLSSRHAASGINLTVANKIILLEPIYGNKEYRTNIENQAIGRSDRIGQNRPIDVYRFIIKDTLEEDIINNNIEEDEIPHITF